MNIAYFWLTMGHYHYARMQAIQQNPEVSLSVVEATNLDDHQWQIERTFKNHSVLLPDQMLSPVAVRKASKKLTRAVPQVDLFVNGAGYYHSSLLKPLLKIKKRGAKMILWSESTALDQPRNSIKEWLKSKILMLYDGAIVAGSSHKDYLISLGMSKRKIRVVGNVVDNDYFATDIPFSKREGFLYAGRFLDIKNIDLLVWAYASYRGQLKNRPESPGKLFLAGDGPEKERISALVKREGIEGIHFYGNLQPEELREAYHRHRIFILPSKSEPWGLVINEAMAAGMPVLASKKCGATEELIEEGNNGYAFDPQDREELVNRMVDMTDNLAKAESMGQRSQEIISRYTPQTYAKKCISFFQEILSDD